MASKRGLAVGRLYLRSCLRPGLHTQVASRHLLARIHTSSHIHTTASLTEQNSDNFYCILGVPPDASDSEIRDAFQKIAKNISPKIMEDEKYRTLLHAYEVLTNSGKREIHDAMLRGQREISSSSKQQEEVRPAGTLRLLLLLSLQEAARGVRGWAEVAVRQPCPHCARHSDTLYPPICAQCRGHRYMQTVQRVWLEVPAGVEDGQTFTTRSRGTASGEPPVLVTAFVLPTPPFWRQGADVHSRERVSLSQAVLGGWLVPGARTLLHGVVPVHLDPGQSEARLPGLGMLRPQGDHVVHLAVDAPHLDTVSTVRRAILKVFAELEEDTPGEVKDIVLLENGRKRALADTREERQIMDKLREALGFPVEDEATPGNSQSTQ